MQYLSINTKMAIEHLSSKLSNLIKEEPYDESLREMTEDNMYERSVILAAKVNYHIPVELLIGGSETVYDARWIKLLHKLKLYISVLEENIPTTMEQNSNAPANIDMKKLLHNAIDNMKIFADTYIYGKYEECYSIPHADITTVSQSADTVFHMVSSMNDTKITSLVTNVYLVYREIIDLLPESIVSFEQPAENAESPYKNAIAEAIVDTPMSIDNTQEEASTVNESEVLEGTIVD